MTRSERQTKPGEVHPGTGGSTGVIAGKPAAPGVRPFESVPPPAQDLAAGTMVAGRYRIDSLIGRGGMGAVYAATQVAMGRPVALKVLRPELATDPAMAARFQREARAVSAIESPNVVVVHDFGQADDGTLFLVMELLAGESLLSRIRRDRFIDPKEAAQIARDVLIALEAAHDAGVVHRDLKPDNVFLMEKGGLKVLDFGIARIVDRSGARGSDPIVTEVGQMLGTPRYMSPEAVARMPVGPAADLYALGAILFEMIAGRPVFTEKEPVILMGHHLRTPAPSLSETAGSQIYVPKDLDRVVSLLLEKLPPDRPTSAATVRVRLARLDWDAPPVPAGEVGSAFAAPPDEVVPESEFVRGHSAARRALRFVPILILIAIIGGILYAHRMRLDAQRRAERESITAVPVVIEDEAPVGEPDEAREP